MRQLSFYDHLKAQQVAWGPFAKHYEGAYGGGIRPPWVLKPEFRTLNLWDPDWWALIRNREHRRSRALTSSQCFAVNLFAPLVIDRALARRALLSLLPHRVLAATDTVEVALEFTPPNGPKWLGERPQQPTQIDDAFIVRRDAIPIGYLLVEVKLGERGLGICRGARQPSPGSNGNPDPDRCRSLAQMLAEPHRQCWLAETEGRHYWGYICEETGPFGLDHLSPDAACPFSGGLYQLMRNRVLAHVLVRRGGAEWADVALCIHPANDAVDMLSEAVGGTNCAEEAFRSLLRSSDELLELQPRAVIEAVLAASPRLAPWAKWVRDRYQL